MNKFSKIFYIAIAVIFLFSMNIWADEDILSSFEIEGADFTYDINTGNIVSEGELVLKGKDFVITVKDVIFDTKNQSLSAKGGIKIESKDISITALSVDMDFKKGIALLEKGTEAKGKEGDKKWQIKGKTFSVKFTFKEDKKGIDEIYAKDGCSFVYDNLKGEAQEIKYLPSKKEIMLSKYVKINDGKNTIIADNIIVDFATKKIITKGKVKVIVNK